MLAFATLGPAGSNHELVTRRYADFLGLGSARIELVVEFAAAVELLRDGRVDCIVQCAAHPDVAWTIGANRAFLFVIDTFVAPGRPLAILTRADVATPSTIAFHPATRSYANLDRWEHRVEEQSTVAVAEGLLSGRYDSGITALEVVDAHPGRLRIDATIGAVDDAWLVYGPVRVCDDDLVAWTDSPGVRWLRERAARS
jgi:hypothetical protein